MSEASSLVNLQEIDSEILRKQVQLDAIPQAQEIKKVRLTLKEVHKRKMQALAMRKDLEMDLEDLEKKEKDLSQEVDKINEGIDSNDDFRRVSDLNKELLNLAKALEKVDFEQNQLYEKLEKVDEAEKLIEESVSKLKTKEQTLIEEYQKAGSLLARELKELKLEREDEANHLGDDMLDVYEQMRNTHSGLAVGSLNKDTCTACKSTFPEGQLIRLRQGPSVTNCPRCKRILVVRLDDDEELLGAYDEEEL